MIRFLITSNKGSNGHTPDSGVGETKSVYEDDQLTYGRYIYIYRCIYIYSYMKK